jgi:Fe2+ or Zn2+ uptake regulation protein
VVNSLDKKTEELTGMKITGHNLSFKGICTKCMKKA